MRQLLPQWIQLTDVVRNGQPVKATNREQGGAEYFAPFVESLFEVNRGAAQTLARHLGLAQVEGTVSVLDIGCGSGVWGLTLAEHAPNVHVRAVDWPPVLEVTRRVAIRLGVAERLTTAEGDFLDAEHRRGRNVHVCGAAGLARGGGLRQRPSAPGPGDLTTGPRRPGTTLSYHYSGLTPERGVSPGI